MQGKNRKCLVFISYSHSDLQFAEEFGMRLKKARIPYFRDVERIDWGDSIPDEVHLHLQKASHLVILISPGSEKSQWVAYETGYARGLNATIVPYLLHPSMDLPGFLMSHRCLRNREEEADFIRSLRKSIKDQTASTAKPTESTQSAPPLNTIRYRIGLLTKGEDLARQHAFQFLVDIGSHAVPELIRALNNRRESRLRSYNSMRDEHLTTPIHEVLIAIGKDAVPELVAEMYNPYDFDCSHIIKKIGLDAVPTLIANCGDKEVAMRKNVTDSLDNIGLFVHEARPLLAQNMDVFISLLSDENKDVRKNAASILAKIGPLPNTVEGLLLSNLAEKTGDDREHALLLLGKIGKPSSLVVSHVAEKVRCNDNLASSACTVLGEIGASLGDAHLSIRDTEVIPTLIDALRRPHHKVREAARDALVFIGIPSVAPLGNLLSLDNKEETASALNTLLKMRGDTYETRSVFMTAQVPIVQFLCQHWHEVSSSDWHFSRITKELNWLHPPAMEIMLKFLSNGSESERSNVLQFAVEMNRSDDKLTATLKSMVEDQTICEKTRAACQSTIRMRETWEEW